MTERSARVALAAWLVLLALAQGYFLAISDPFSLYGGPEELMMEFVAARNFVDYGFWKNLLLPDYSVSPSVAEHPYLYTHMPSLPSVIVGVFLKLGAPLLLIRFFFGAITLLGMIYVYRFWALMYGNAWVGFAATVALSFSFSNYILWTDHFVHCFYWLTVFGCFFHSLRYVRSKERSDLYAYLALLLLALCTSYFTVVAILAYGFLNLLLVPAERPTRLRLLSYSVALSAGFLAIFITRNALVLGPQVAFSELLYTLGNRTIAYPKREALAAFFSEHGIVWWGASQTGGSAVASWLVRTVSDKGAWLRLALAVCLLVTLMRRQSGYFVERVAQYLVFLVAIFSWNLIFWGHAQGYFLSIHTGVFVSATVALLVGSLIAYFRQVPRLPKYRTAFACLGVVLCLIGAKKVYKSLSKEATLYQEIGHKNFLADEVRSVDYLRELEGKTIWTNLNPLVVNFFTPARVLGHCDESALLDLIPDRCFAKFFRQTQGLDDWKTPSYIFLSRIMPSGNTPCPPALGEAGRCFLALEASLKKRHQLVKETPYWMLFKI